VHRTNCRCEVAAMRCHLWRPLSLRLFWRVWVKCVPSRICGILLQTKSPAGELDAGRSSQRKRFAGGTVASRGVWGGASGRGASSSYGWNFHRAALSDSSAVFLNRRLSTVLPGAKVDSGPLSWGPRINA